MRQKVFGLIGVALGLTMLSTCGVPGSGVGQFNLKRAQSLSAHYVLVQFEGQVDQRAANAEKYQIVDSGGSRLDVSEAVLSDDLTEVLLTTAEQQDIGYELMYGDTSAFELGRAIPIGMVGFQGSSQREPFLESAVSLSSTEILLTFSHEMDRESAETVAFYEIADPDGNTDIDIRITGATIQTDHTTVILTTTPQENIEYQIRATNIKRRFSCSDSGRVFLDSTTQGTTCAGMFRPNDAIGNPARYSLTARMQIDRNQPLNPDATGSGASVGLDAYGAGVRRPLCNGGNATIDGGNGTDPDEELIIVADRAELAENIVLGVRELQFGVDRPVLFVSSEASTGYDYVIDTPGIFAAINTGLTVGDIVFANIPAFPPGLKIDAIKLRETNDALYLNSICGLATNRSLIDPTRNAASFFGIPPVDEAGPRVVRAESSSDTEVIVSFSEPLDSEAANPVNFSISSDLTVIDVQIKKFDTQVVLTTSPQRVDVLYTVNVSNVRDKAGNLIDPAANSATFYYDGGPAGLGADALPRVVGAASTGNTGVLVVFNKPMGPSAEVAGNYVIVQENVNPEVGALAVLSASFASGQQDAVELVTASQNEVTYNLQVINVRDLSGNQLAPPQLLVDPSRAIFAGTPFSCGDAPCELPDADGDTISDAAELRGYVVTVELTNGDTIDREVTSDPFSADTDGDGLNDAEERRIGCDPRSPDTDADQLKDYVEYNVVYSDQNDQDTDDDGVDDLLEVDFFKTNALLADSDGDGFDDGVELYEMNRDPRIADLPQPGLVIGSIDLHLDEQFTYADQDGVVRTQDSSTSSSLSVNSARTVSTSTGTTLGFNINGKGGFGFEYPTTKWSITAELSAGFNYSQTLQTSRQSAVATTNAYEQSLSKGLSISGSTSFTRNVTGGRIDALVSLSNLSDVAFKLSNLEITVSVPDPDDHSNLLPVATLIPNKTLITGEPQTYNIGVLGNSTRGPILFSSRDVFPSVVEDLMRDPNGLVFEFANYDLQDEFDRGFAFASQTARDRTVGLVIDFGDGNPQRYLVASAPVRFAHASCDPLANPGCDIVGGFAGFADAGIPPYSGLGRAPGLPLEYVLEEVLQLRRSEPVITPIWQSQPSFLPEITDRYVCLRGFNDGNECDHTQGDPDADCKNGSNDGLCSNAVPNDGILAGGNGVSDSIAQGDDIQLIPFGIDGLPEDAVVIMAGNNGVLDTTVRRDDVGAIITGYSTTKTCGPDTDSFIRTGPDGIAETIRDPFSDDVQLNQGDNVIGPGSNGFIDTAPAGDDVYVGPGIPCDDDGDCPGAGVCDGQEILYRFEHRFRGQFGRIWAVVVPNENVLGMDFRKVLLQPGEVLNLAFIQDLDRDGLIADVEFLFGSSDTRQDTDGDGLDDFSEVRVGWDIGVEGESIRTVFSDPRLVDSDSDGLTDREEQDIRRVQCECVGGNDQGRACNRVINTTEPERDACRGGSCRNVADPNFVDSADPTVLYNECSTVITDNRLDPRRRDTDGDLVSDSDEVIGWKIQAAVIDPKNVIIAGTDRVADTQACPSDVCYYFSCQGGFKDGAACDDTQTDPDVDCKNGSNDGTCVGVATTDPCRFQRDCPPRKECEGGANDGANCTNDIDCKGPTPADSGLCNDSGASHKCNRTTCDDVQVIAVGTVGVDPRAVVVAPGPDGELDTVADSNDQLVAGGNLLAQTSAVGDDQQIALVDPARSLVDSTIGRTIIRPGVNGAVDTLPTGDDVVAYGQFLRTTDPLSQDTDRDQISEGLERILGSDPRDATDGGFLGDRDGDGLTDGQEEVVGWIVVANGGQGYDVHPNANISDSDQDDLPDYAEFVLRTDPNKPDTDGDGINDLDELSARQLASLERFNDLFQNYYLNVDLSAALGTNPLDCDTDGDFLTDDFELLVGWAVTRPADAESGPTVTRVFSDPTRRDTDNDGLDDGAEYKHTLGGSPAPPTDPNDYDTDGDGRLDGVECTPPPQTPVLADCTNPTTEVLGICTNDPLVPDKKVTVRYVQMTVERGNPDGALSLVDISYELGVTRSDEAFDPSVQRFVTSELADCPGDFYQQCNPPQCQLKEGKDIVFNLLRETIYDPQTDTHFLKNERIFALKPGQGLLLNGVIDQWEGCPVSTWHVKGRCTDDVSGEEGLGCCDTDASTDCPSGETCILSSFEPRTCQGCPWPTEGRACIGDGDCIVAAGPLTCGRCLGTPCTGALGDPCTFNPLDGTYSLECRPSTTNGPSSHLTYSKSLSFETLINGFSTDIVTLSDGGGEEGGTAGFGVTLTVEIIVE